MHHDTWDLCSTPALLSSPTMISPIHPLPYFHLLAILFLLAHSHAQWDEPNLAISSPTSQNDTGLTIHSSNLSLPAPAFGFSSSLALLLAPRELECVVPGDSACICLLAFSPNARALLKSSVHSKTDAVHLLRIVSQTSVAPKLRSETSTSSVVSTLTWCTCSKRVVARPLLVVNLGECV
jgi:hypothetical protein